MSETSRLEDPLALLSPSWEQVGTSSACRLLRLALLRELVRHIHTLRSDCMATGRERQALDLGKREEFLTAHFTSLSLESSSLARIYEESAGAPPNKLSEEKKSEPLAFPEELRRNLDPSKFARSDRHFEAEIAREALKRHWSFWQFEASAEIHKIEKFATFFSEGLWPQGVVLFVESDGFIKTSEKTPDLAYWRGRWTLILDSTIRDSSELKLDFSNWGDAEPHWKRIS